MAAPVPDRFQAAVGVIPGLSQVEVAQIVRSSQPRVALMEAADRSVSIDLLVKALVKTGVSVREIGRSIETAGRPHTLASIRAAVAAAGPVALPPSRVTIEKMKAGIAAKMRRKAARIHRKA